MDHSQRVFLRWRHKDNRDGKRGLGVQATAQMTECLRAVAIFARPSLAFDLVTRL